MPVRSSSSFLAAAVWCVALPSVGRAQAADSTRLPAVVVTATRVESTVGSRIASVTVLDGAALRQWGLTDVAEALRQVPGVSIVRSGGAGAQTSLFVRGGESDYVRVLVDGVAINDPGGSVDLASLTLDNVERIEVVRGPSSVLYGTDAVTGVVQIFTRRPASAQEVEATVTAGSYGLRNGELSLGAASGRVALTAGAARRTSDGILAFNNGYRNDALSARFTATPGRDVRLSLTARQNRDEFHYPTDGAGAVVDRNAFRTGRRSVLALTGDVPLSTRLRAGMSLSLLEGRGHTDDAADNAADTLGLYVFRNTGSVRRRGADGYLSVLANASTTVTVGGEWSVEAQRSADSSNYGPTANRFAAERENRAAYAQVLGEQGRLSYSVGGRYDDNEVFGAFRTARAGAALRVWRGGTVRASLGTAFKAPAFLEQFNTAFSLGNRDLRPERSRSYEIGASQSFASDRVSAGAVWFSQRFRDLIQYAFLDAALPNYFNIADASARGVELEVRARVSNGLAASANATLLRTRVEDAGFDTGEGAGATFVNGGRLLRRAPRTLSLQLASASATRVSWDATLTHVGARDDRDFTTFPAVPVELGAYTRLDLSSEVRLLPRVGTGGWVSLLLRAENVFGAGYSEVANYPAPGRIISIGVRAGGTR